MKVFAIVRMSSLLDVFWLPYVAYSFNIVFFMIL